ncbi:hypothetical protein JEQ12_020288 [Ovis aries]|uniref:HSF-type DNA-binding domain-containing protein n=1 Tax=Ovis aries TaxID=9940 RepID=A0A835ZL17_SHEEP|nr:hypothetical protein JEQ12_020288 [Ovis aries]
MPGFGRGVPFFQTQGLWPSAQGDVPLPVDLSVVLAQLMPTGHHSFRLLLEESTFQALRKLWTIVNSHRFVSIWWAEDSTCVGVSEEHFENILERVGSDKVFETDHKKSLFHQLSLY